MSIPYGFPTPANPYQGQRFGYSDAAALYHFEEIPDSIHFGASPQPPSFLKRVFGGVLKLGGLLLGGLAFKRYCPGLAAQIGGLIPEFIQAPFKALSGNWLGRRLIQGAESLLNRSEAIFNTLKGFFGGFFNKAG